MKYMTLSKMNLKENSVKENSLKVFPLYKILKGTQCNKSLTSRFFVLSF